MQLGSEPGYLQCGDKYSESCWCLSPEIDCLIFWFCACVFVSMYSIFIMYIYIYTHLWMMLAGRKPLEHDLAQCKSSCVSLAPFQEKLSACAQHAAEMHP